MKTAISIPDKVFADADRLAKRLKKSRSQLYSEAVEDYVSRHSDDEITESWNLALKSSTDDDRDLEAFVAEAARRTLKRVQW